MITTSDNTPTVILVHGGFADASFWTPVIQKLQARGIPVLAPPNPLRGLARDAEYIADPNRVRPAHGVPAQRRAKSASRRRATRGLRRPRPMRRTRRPRS